MDDPIPRHIGLDWLRIGAFALLILFHIGLYFAPGTWIITRAEPIVAFEWPMLALTSWRLPLLFLVSGYASRALLVKLGGPRAFLASRSLRLLLPLGFGMLAIVPPQTWVRLATDHGYAGSYGQFWVLEWLGFRAEMSGVELFAHEHLWFIAYLWAYSMLLAAAIVLLPGAHKRRLSAWFDALGKGWRLLWMPAAAIVVLRLGLLFVVPEEHGLLRDWAGHVQYFPAILFGFGLAGTLALWPALARVWRAAALSALIFYLVMLRIDFLYLYTVPPHAEQALLRGSGVAMGWSMILLLLFAANRWLQRDHPWRAKLGEAVFPFYLVHQTIIVLAAFSIRDLGLAPAAEFAILLAATGAGCLAFYEMGRRISWLRPFIGLARTRPQPRLAESPAT